MSRYTEHSKAIYQKTQKDCSDFSERVAVKKAQQKIVDIIRKMNLLNAGERFIDVGCGAGQFVALIQKEFNSNAYGVTLNESEVANANRSKITVIQSDMHDINSPDDEFKVLYAGHVLEHSVSPTVALREWRRVIADNGYLLIWGPIGRDFKGNDDGTVVYGCLDHLLTPTEWQYKWMFEISELELVAEFDITYQSWGRKMRLRRFVKRIFMKFLNCFGMTLLPKYVPGSAAFYILKKKK